MNNIFSDFTHRYNLSKTLKFELKPYIPINLTEEEKEKYLEALWENYFESSLYKNDENRNESYVIVKILLDIFHRRFIKDALSSFECTQGHTWEDLYNLYIKDKKSKDFSELQKKIRADIVVHLKKHEWWPNVNSTKDLIENTIPFLISGDDDFLEEAKSLLGLDKETLLMHLARFKSFSVYFKKYKENRDNMYSEKDQTTAISNRIVNENFPKFADNISVYNRLIENCQFQLREIEKKLKAFLSGCTLNDVFTPAFFNLCLTQTGIAHYNWILGGNPNENVIGINDVGNKYLQQNPQSNLKLKDLRMAMLYKQILSDKERLSFIPKQFEKGHDGEIQMINAIKQLYLSFQEQCLFDKVKNIFSQIGSTNVDSTKIYVVGKNLSFLSKTLYGSWNVLGEALRKHFVIGSSKKVKQEFDKDVTEWITNKCFSLAEIRSVESELLGEHSTKIDDFLSSLTLNVWNEEIKKWEKESLVDVCNEAYTTIFVPIEQTIKDEGSINNNDACKELIKTYLDKYMDILHCCEIFRLGKMREKLETDSIYVEYDSLFENVENDVVTLSDIIPLYNQVRNFLTRKISDEGKMLLKFDSPTLADGWDSNSEQSNNAVILTRDGKYYVLILNPQNKPNLNHAINGKSGYKKLVYHQVGNVAADIPNLMVIDGRTVKKNGRKDKKTGENTILEELRKQYLPKEINRIREDKSYIKDTEKFNKKDLQTYIEYYKQRIIEYKQGDIVFNFKSEYDSYSDFLNDVTQQKFSMSFVDYDLDEVNSWIKSNQAFLFQISNKDFQQGAHGTENMHTLYWKEIFSPQNLWSLEYKINGHAEFFYRRKIENTPYIHKKSSVLVNKTYADGTPIKSEDYKAFVKYFNRDVIELTDEQTKLLPQIKTNKAKIDIVKDKRYTEHKFLFHVPITINYKSEDCNSNKAFNEYTLQKLREYKDDVNIIGIDRGERNLIYVSVINQRGENIIPPRHYNIVETQTYDNKIRKYNYLEKLKQVEGDRDAARKNWTKIENIKELKSGYLSQVVHEISKLVVKYNAIIVLEDLNFGFKRGRFNVERQVYQKFESMLIKKLNFLVFKKDAPSVDYGNIHNGLQLTHPFTRFKDLGKQCGWLFYVPAEYTSKIDAETGFVNLFNLKKASENPKEFFKAFRSIEYKDGLFYFSFDYSSNDIPTLKSDYTNKWTLSSHGNRIVMVKNKTSQRMEPKEINLTEEIKSVFNGKIDLNDLSIQALIEHPEAEIICKDLLYKFKWLLQMRNSMPNDDKIDYLISPVAGKSPFVTGMNNKMGINDADANGAYHIALKGLYWLQNDFPTDGDFMQRITLFDWLEFVQKHNYRTTK